MYVASPFENPLYERSFGGYQPYEPNPPPQYIQQSRAPKGFSSKRRTPPPLNQIKPLSPSIQKRSPQLPKVTKLPERPRTSSSNKQQLSSPIRIKGDAGVNREMYFTWLIRKSPSKREGISKAYRKVKNAYISLQYLRKLTNDKWRLLGILISLAKRIRDNLKPFQAK